MYIMPENLLSQLYNYQRCLDNEPKFKKNKLAYFLQWNPSTCSVELRSPRTV